MVRPLVPVVLLALCVAAAPARAQDRDPFDAVLQAQQVREKQMTGVQRAERRVNDPYGFDGDGRAGETRLPVERKPGKAEGAAPWLIPAGIAAALAAFFVIRRRRRNPWSELPGHQGLRR